MVSDIGGRADMHEAWLINTPPRMVSLRLMPRSAERLWIPKCGHLFQSSYSE